MTITLTREEAQQVLDALDEYYITTDEGKQLIETIRARLSAPEPEKSLSQKLADAGYTKRDDRLECDECGKKFTRQMLPIHDCQPEPEPVACKHCGAKGVHACPGYRWAEARTPPSVTFADPSHREPERKWQGLTDGEIKELRDLLDGEWVSYEGFARAIEAKLKEKNHAL